MHIERSISDWLSLKAESGRFLGQSYNIKRTFTTSVHSISPNGHRIEMLECTHRLRPDRRPDTKIDEWIDRVGDLQRFEWDAPKFQKVKCGGCGIKYGKSLENLAHRYVIERQIYYLHKNTRGPHRI